MELARQEQVSAERALAGPALAARQLAVQVLGCASFRTSTSSGSSNEPMSRARRRPALMTPRGATLACRIRSVCPTSRSTKFYVGYGWYRKHFTVPSTWLGKSVFIEFQAAFDQAQIYVNGKQVGQHIGGYNGFSIDISSAIQAGDNVVAVQLNNNWNAQIPPLTGDHTFQGGLYRDVNLVITDPLHVTWYGTWITTPTLATNSGSSSTVEIKTEVQNNRAAAVNATLKTDIVDSSGKVITTVSSQQQIAAGATVTFDQTTPAVSNPSLWHPDHPTMYQALSNLSDGTGNVDTFTTPFGFRWFAWSASQGFSLNGSHYWIQGGNVHQDHAGWGDGVTDSALYRDVKMVKDAGMNFIRGSHYPKAPAFADACDQLGVLFWSENCFWGGFGGGGGWPYNGAYPSTSADYDTFDSNVLASLTDMIRIHRNHPSIIAWSMGNEDFFNGGPADRVIALLKKAVALTHQLDPAPTGRPAAIGGAQSAIGGTQPDTLGDVAGFNGDGTGYDNPGMPNLVSEYGSVSSTRPGSYDPGWANLAVTNGMPTQYAWRSGVSKWCVFDHGTQDAASYGIMGIVRLLSDSEALLLLVSQHVREGGAADLAKLGYARGAETHVEHDDAHSGGRHAGRVAARHCRGLERQTD